MSSRPMLSAKVAALASPSRPHMTTPTHYHMSQRVKARGGLDGSRYKFSMPIASTVTTTAMTRARVDPPHDRTNRPPPRGDGAPAEPFC